MATTNTITNPPPNPTPKKRPPQYSQVRAADKREYALRMNVLEFIKLFGEDHVLFLTITFQARTSDAECKRRFNCLRTGVLKKRYGCGIVKRERQEIGTIHYHLLLAAPGAADVRTGVDIEVLRRSRGDQRITTNDAFNAERTFVEDELPALYSLGTEVHLEPVQSAKGLALYFTKKLANLSALDRHAHLVTYIDPARSQAVSPNFSWARGRAREYRRVSKEHALYLHSKGLIAEPTEREVYRFFQAAHRKAWSHRLHHAVTTAMVDGSFESTFPRLSYEEAKRELARQRRPLALIRAERAAQNSI